ncbi:MAG: response regulator [Desulfobacterales bacterium]|jgi:CheY-like chemotaxis protein|nr:response regulator [Desulfobacteraceae bacterium]MBT4365123.1 response regulator [Desulfobacteraceae bacterium]MBT7085576.1 response regulator [Desulfobacterales bacterium]MBT7698362.1 response regulator [Desulfobacterales bacterium]
MGKKILIIDDDEVIAKYLKKFLENNGYTTTNAIDGKLGMDMIKKDKPDLILLDVMMETLYSGFEVYRQVKLDSELNTIPIIGISGMSDEIDVKFDPARDAEYFSPDDFLEKPVDKELLLKKIDKLIRTL